VVRERLWVMGGKRGAKRHGPEVMGGKEWEPNRILGGGV
jgi:hypothetical protein